MPPRGMPPTALLLVSDPSAYMANSVISMDGGSLLSAVIGRA